MAFADFQRRMLIAGKVDYDHRYNFQCVDLIRQYLYDDFGLGDNAGGVPNAISYWTNTPAAILNKFDKLNTSSVQAGDVAVLRSFGHTDLEGDGHIVIGTGNSNDTKFEALEQNGQTGNGSGTGGDAIRTRYIERNRVLGVLRPKSTLPPVSDPAPHLEMPAGEFFNMPKGQTFWGLEKIWGLNHGTLQQLNPDLNPRTIPSNAQIRIRPAAASAPAPVVPAVGDEFYVIKKNDTLWDLETAWNMPHGTLLQLNPGLNPRALKIDGVIRRKAAPQPEPAPAPAPVVAEPVKAPEPPLAIPGTDISLPSSVIVAASESAAAAAAKAAASATELHLRQSARVKQEAAAKLTFREKHFTKDKVLKDLTAFGLTVGAVMAWAVDNHALVGALLSTLSGIVFGENRFKIKK